MFKHETIPVIKQRTVNVTCEFDGFHLNYNPQRSGYGTDTTAIVMENTLFFVLNGDHMTVLQAVAKEAGLQGCIDYFIENIGQANQYSEHIAVINGETRYGLAESGLKLAGQANIDRIAKAVTAILLSKLTQSMTTLRSLTENPAQSSESASNNNPSTVPTSTLH
jgi:hypothetical protein